MMRGEPAPFGVWICDHSRYAGGLWTECLLRRATAARLIVHAERDWDSPRLYLPRNKLATVGEHRRAGEWYRVFVAEWRKFQLDAEAKAKEAAAQARRREEWLRQAQVMPSVDHRVALLDLPRQFTRAEVLRAFRRLSKRTHPDVGGDPARFRELMAARDFCLTLALKDAAA